VVFSEVRYRKAQNITMNIPGMQGSLKEVR
jgi:hypothetical protein